MGTCNPRSSLGASRRNDPQDSWAQPSASAIGIGSSVWEEPYLSFMRFHRYESTNADMRPRCCGEAFEISLDTSGGAGNALAHPPCAVRSGGRLVRWSTAGRAGQL